MSKFKFVKDVTPANWRALPRAFKAGEEIHEFNGYDYGCVRDDFYIGGYQTIACSLSPTEGPFFTVPVGLIQDEQGKHPPCRCNT